MKTFIGGAGKEAKSAIEFCRNIGTEIFACVDSDTDKCGKTICGLEIISPQQLQNTKEAVTVIISSALYQESIKETILALGIKCKIVKRTELMPYKSYAQYGEDVVVASILKACGIERISYAEIGIPTAISGSNTRYFYDLGMRGLCVEANPDRYEELCKNRQGDTVVNIGVGGNAPETEMPFYCFKDSDGLNTFEASLAELRISQGFVLDKIQNIKCVGLTKIFAEYCKEIPDFVSIDIEGMESKVMQDFDFSEWPVKIWCIEKCKGSVPEIMRNNGYILSAETPSNWIYCLKELDNEYIKNWAGHVAK